MDKKQIFFVSNKALISLKKNFLELKKKNSDIKIF